MHNEVGPSYLLRGAQGLSEEGNRVGLGRIKEREMVRRQALAVEEGTKTTTAAGRAD